jgi:hypothetical protein
LPIVVSPEVGSFVCGGGCVVHLSVTARSYRVRYSGSEDYKSQVPKKSYLLKSGGKHLLMCCHLSVALLCCVGFACAAHHLHPNSLVNIVDGVGPSRVGWLFSDYC